MPKMTEEQKAANKEHRRRRDKAWRARMKERSERGDQLRGERLPEHEAVIEEAHKAEESVIAERDAALKEIDDKIANLKFERERLADKHGELTLAARQVSRRPTRTSTPSRTRSTSSSTRSFPILPETGPVQATAPRYGKLRGITSPSPLPSRGFRSSDRVVQLEHVVPRP